MLKTEKRRKKMEKQGSYTRTGLLAHPGILYVLQLGREDSKRVWISLDFPDKSEVMCRCGYKHDDMIV